MRDGFWINPQGKIVRSRTSHINDITANPSKFGTTRDEILALHEKYGEKMGREGRAREELIINALKNGHMRIRQYGNKGFSVTVWKITMPVKDYLYDWAVGMKEGRLTHSEWSPFTEVRINPVAPGTTLVVTNMESLLNFSAWEDQDERGTCPRLEECGFEWWADTDFLSAIEDIEAPHDVIDYCSPSLQTAAEDMEIRHVVYPDVLRALDSGDLEYLNYVSLTRLWQAYKRMLNLGTKHSFAILMSDPWEWIDGGDPNVNYRNFGRLVDIVTGAQLAYIRLRGRWYECPVKVGDIAVCAGDNLVLSEEFENWLFILGLTLGYAKQLAFDTFAPGQDTLIYMGPGTDGNVMLVWADGRKKNLGGFHPRRIAQACHDVRKGSGKAGRVKCIFGFEFLPQSWFDRLCGGGEIIDEGHIITKEHLIRYWDCVAPWP
ncbi:hypothetical protein ACFLU6_05755 [Acidobacteriota bacterium]